MAVCNSKSPTRFRMIQQSQPLLFLNFLKLTIFVFVRFPFANSISFQYTSFQPSDSSIHYQGDAFAANGAIELTNALDTDSFTRVGRASYADPVHLWDSKTRNLIDFNTYFSFNITPSNNTDLGDGLTFFLSPYNASIPNNTQGGLLGLFNSTGPGPTNNQVVAIEFDTKQDSWDPSPNHLGFDVNSIASVSYAELNDSLVTGAVVFAWVFYNSTTKTLNVLLSYQGLEFHLAEYYNHSYVIDLRNVLPEWVSVGFSASLPTGSTERHTITSWYFNSSYLTVGDDSNSTSGASPSNSASGASPSKINPGLVALPIGIGSLIFGVCIFLCIRKGRGMSKKSDQVNNTPQESPERAAHAVGNMDIEGDLSVECGGDNNVGNVNITYNQIGSRELPTGGTGGELLRGTPKEAEALITKVVDKLAAQKTGGGASVGDNVRQSGYAVCRLQNRKVIGPRMVSH